MAHVYDLVKNRKVYSLDADRTVLEASRYMMEHNIGAVPVLRNGDLVGIFSERDIMNRVVAAGRMPGATKISEVMTSNPKTVSVQETVDNCLFVMREFGSEELVCELPDKNLLAFAAAIAALREGRPEPSY